jgi:hypothetical protein
MVAKSSLFAIRSVSSHSCGKQLTDGGKPLFGRRGTLGIGHHRWLRSGVWKQQTRFQDTYAGEGADCLFSGEIAVCHQNDVGQILSHLTRERTATWLFFGVAAVRCCYRNKIISCAPITPPPQLKTLAAKTIPMGSMPPLSAHQSEKTQDPLRRAA